MVWLSSFIAAMLLTVLPVVVRAAELQGLPRQLTLSKGRPSNYPSALTRSQHCVAAARYTGKADAFLNDGSRLTDAVAAG
jgi:hypothetical protein